MFAVIHEHGMVTVEIDDSFVGVVFVVEKAGSDLTKG
jgi:hypothetical protein